MGTVITSIGSNTSIDTETTSSCSGSDPYVTTFASAPSGVSVGDKATATDAFANTYIYLVTVVSGADITLKYISGGSGTASPCSLGSFGGGASVTFKRYYSTITLWEDALDDTAVYSSSDDAVGECYDDSNFGESGVLINGGYTVGLDSITLTVASGERHDGTSVGSGVRILQGSNWTTTVLKATSRLPVTIEWLRFDCAGYYPTTGGSDGAIVEIKALIASSAYVKTVRNCLLYHADGDKMFAAISLPDARTAKTVTNNIIYRIYGDGSYATYGIYTNSDPTNGDAIIYNNTIHNVLGTGSYSFSVGMGIYPKDHAAMFVKNNLVTECDECIRDITYSAAAIDYNAASDTTAAGANSLNSITPVNQYESNTVGSEDLHLKDNADALRAGVDLVQTPAGVQYDIDGRDRHTETDTWDIGADQCESCSTSAGGTVVPQIMNTYKQMAGY